MRPTNKDKPTDIATSRLNWPWDNSVERKERKILTFNCIISFAPQLPPSMKVKTMLGNKCIRCEVFYLLIIWYQDYWVISLEKQYKTDLKNRQLQNYNIKKNQFVQETIKTVIRQSGCLMKM